MADIEQAFHDVVARIWSSTVGTELTRVDLGDATPSNPLSATVPFLGDWQGDIEVQVDETLARAVGAKMLLIEQDQLSDADLRDALGEVTNMIGGNLRATLSPTCDLGTPTVTEPGEPVERSDQLTVLFASEFVSESHPIRVTLRSNQEAA